jgi:hypothetical protein
MVNIIQQFELSYIEQCKEIHKAHLKANRLSGRVKIYEFRGKQYSFSELAELPECKISKTQLRRRLNKGMSIEEAVIMLPKTQPKQINYNREYEVITLNPKQFESKPIFYIYAFIDPEINEPFYIGKGHNDRWKRHFRQPYINRCTLFYNKLRKMKREGIKPIIEIIKDNLNEVTAYEVESILIHLIGRRDIGTGPLCNHYAKQRGKRSGSIGWSTAKKCGYKPVQCWNKSFPTLAAVSCDSRCIVSYKTLAGRIRRNWSIQKAAETPSSKFKCWDKFFPSIAAVARDSRCIVKVQTLRTRIKQGWSIQKAAEEPLLKNYSTGF